MNKNVKIGIIICDRYRRCAGGKCLRALREREGAFSRYVGKKIELVGYTTCDGCPGGNIEYAVDEMQKNGVKKIHLATGLIVGYPPCPYLKYFNDFITNQYGLDVVYGTHPIPQKYFETHGKIGTWEDFDKWNHILAPVLTDKKIRQAYN